MAAERGDVRNSATLPPRERRQLPPRIHRANTTTTQQMDHASEQSAIPTPSRPVPSRIASTRQHNMNYGFNDASPDAPLPPQQPQQYQQQVPMRRNPSSTGREPVNMVLRDPYGQAGSTVTRPPRSPRIAGMEASGAFSSTMGRSSPLEPPGSVTASVVDEYSGIGASINQSEGNGFAPRTAFRRPGAPAKTYVEYEISVLSDIGGASNPIARYWEIERSA
ncbi:hypothetical protein BC830DRAFT_662252 [Chytriomyces sp. MP71]|nr:hypothetical protein BC830DRAFT_662252 [Chytriomyces sp. MP71]